MVMDRLRRGLLIAAGGLATSGGLPRPDPARTGGCAFQGDHDDSVLGGRSLRRGERLHPQRPELLGSELARPLRRGRRARAPERTLARRLQAEGESLLRCAALWRIYPGGQAQTPRPRHRLVHRRRQSASQEPLGRDRAAQAGHASPSGKMSDPAERTISALSSATRPSRGTRSTPGPGSMCLPPCGITSAWTTIVSRPGASLRRAMFLPGRGPRSSRPRAITASYCSARPIEINVSPPPEKARHRNAYANCRSARFSAPFRRKITRF